LTKIEIANYGSNADSKLVTELHENMEEHPLDEGDLDVRWGI
jgi:hypothetical protein